MGRRSRFSSATDPPSNYRYGSNLNLYHDANRHQAEQAIATGDNSYRPPPPPFTPPLPPPQPPPPPPPPPPAIEVSMVPYDPFEYENEVVSSTNYLGNSADGKSTISNNKNFINQKHTIPNDDSQYVDYDSDPEYGELEGINQNLNQVTTLREVAESVENKFSVERPELLETSRDNYDVHDFPMDESEDQEPVDDLNKGTNESGFPVPEPTINKNSAPSVKKKESIYPVSDQEKVINI